MNGGRGAKGSINDRLISMMYRERYKKWKLKRNGYKNIAPREHAIVYLKEIQKFDIDKPNYDLELSDKLVLEEALKPEDEVVVNVPVKENTIDSVKSISSRNIESPIIKFEENKTTNSKEENTISSIPIPKVEEVKSYTPNDISALHNANNIIMEFDPKTEDYDFEKYDYYELVQNTTKVGTISSDEVINPEKEIEVQESSITVIKEFVDFVDDSKEILDEIKEEITEVNKLIDNAKTEEEVKELEVRINKLREKINNLKNKYDIVKEKYDISDFAILDSITYMNAIENLHDKASVEELEIMVDICKTEIDAIDEVVVEEKRSVGVKEKLKEKQDKIETRDNEFRIHRDKVDEVNQVKNKVISDTNKQIEALNEIKKHLYDYEIEIVKTTKVVNQTYSLFGSFLRVAAGILTAPLSNVRLFGPAFGTHLINRGIRGLREYLNPEIVTTEEEKRKYRDMEYEILNSKDYVSTTKKVISDSIWQLNELEKEFNISFADYVDVIPEYYDVLKQINHLKTIMNKKQEEIKLIDNDLDKQYEANKVKMLKQ